MVRFLAVRRRRGERRTRDRRRHACDARFQGLDPGDVAARCGTARGGGAGAGFHAGRRDRAAPARSRVAGSTARDAVRRPHDRRHAPCAAPALARRALRGRPGVGGIRHGHGGTRAAARGPVDPRPHAYFIRLRDRQRHARGVQPARLYPPAHQRTGKSRVCVGQSGRTRLSAGPSGRVMRPFPIRKAARSAIGAARSVRRRAYPHWRRLHPCLHRAQQIARRRGGGSRTKQNSKADHQLRIHCDSGYGQIQISLI
ncbi:hypothetical protein BDI4_760017 [Burkholderia diffusa]|nr:hypothetical protein BDI4_760017 [Burkholderia diffusa]